MYHYQLLKQDGSIIDLDYHKEWKLEQIREVLKCGTVELIPQQYYQKAWGNCTVWGDEEGRFSNLNIRNPHMQVLKGSPSLGEPAEWDCVGDLLLQQKVAK